MKAIQELILNKLVPLGFEEKELMYTVQVKMNENVFKTKKDVILYFEQVIWMYQDQEAIRQLLQS